jgi:hypothetical protein
MLRGTTISLFLLSVLLAGCDEVTKIVEIPAPPIQSSPPPPAPPPPSPPPPSEPPQTVAESLRELGISTARSPRTSNEGVPLPDNYSPFGTLISARIDDQGSAHLGSPLELALVGFSIDEEDSVLTLIDNIPIVARANVVPIFPQVLHERNIGQAAWAQEYMGAEGVAPVTRRSVAAGDIDGNGIDELAIVRVENGQVILEVRAVDDPGAPVFNGVVPVPASISVVNDLRIAAGDFDGDRKGELAIAVSGPRAAGQRTRTSLLLFDERAGGFELLRELAFESTLQQVAVHVVLEAGNVDYDVQDELVVVINEIEANNDVPTQAAARLFVFDDSSGGYAQLLADTPSVVTTTSTRTAQTADVAIGDFDGDDINEIIAAGMSGITGGNATCNTSGDVRYVAVLYEFDGRSIGKTSMAANAANDAVYPITGDCPDAQWMLRFAFVNAVDLDGDLDHEFHVNQYVFAEFPAPNASWDQTAFAVLDSTTLFPSGARYVVDRHSTVIQSGDVNGDGRGDLVSFRAGNDELSVYSQTAADGFYRSARVPIETQDAVYGTGAGAVNPQLLPFSADLRNEGEIVVLQFEEHFLDYTEPLVLAALAAPPCIEDAGQNVDACTTTWGKSEAVTVEGEREFKFKAGTSVGLKIEQDVPVTGTMGYEFSLKGTLEREASRIRNEAYEVSKTISFETGPLEDSVVYTSVPYDVYRYTKVNATSVNDSPSVYDIGLPREAVIRIATARFYNAHTRADALKIDESVFTHRAGEIDSYPTAEQRDALLAERRTQVQALRTQCSFCWQADPYSMDPFFDGLFRTFDPFTALPGLTSKELGVGQGSGATEVGIELSSSNGFGRALETSIEVEVEFAAAGLSVGFQFGGGVATSTKVSRTNGSSYEGVIGSIDAEHFLDNQYRFGLFTYLQSDPGSGLEFEVINYWVEQDDDS